MRIFILLNLDNPFVTCGKLMLPILTYGKVMLPVGKNGVRSLNAKLGVTADGAAKLCFQ
jgi:hypothetical protein